MCGSPRGGSRLRKILVTQRVSVAEHNEIRDSLDQRLIEFVLATGGTPFPVPNGLDSESDIHAWVDCIDPVGLVLTGGNSIGEVSERDFTEFALLDYAQHHSLPTLGICRGMQIMGVWANVELLRVDGHVRTRHHLNGEIERSVNSYHEYALATCPECFRVLASDESGNIEAFRHQSLPWEGWMWHPEREPRFDSHDVSRFRSLLI